MLKSSRHPYQTTTLPQTNYPISASNTNCRNTWADKIESSTNSSCGNRSGHTSKNITPQPAAEWLLTGNQTMSHMGSLLNQQVHPVIVQTQGPGSAVSIGRVSSGAVSTGGRIGSCGGQCVACETFCYYCLQVIFIAGILTGIALTIAGSVLHESQRDGHLVVLLYIGVLLVLVCILLLSVHCCVRHNVKERKRALRMTLIEGGRREVSGDFTAVPIQDFTADPSVANSYAETDLNEYDPRENPRPVNIIPNPNLHYQIRHPPNHTGSMRFYSYERYPHQSEMQQPYEWGKSTKAGGSRVR